MDEYDRIANFYRANGVEPPRRYQHGTIEDIRNNLKQIKPNTWKLQGNILYGETDMGKLAQYIPTDYICVGSDKGLPVLQKVVLS